MLDLFSPPLTTTRRPLPFLLFDFAHRLRMVFFIIKVERRRTRNPISRLTPLVAELLLQREVHDPLLILLAMLTLLPQSTLLIETAPISRLMDDLRVEWHRRIRYVSYHRWCLIRYRSRLPFVHLRGDTATGQWLMLVIGGRLLILVVRGALLGLGHVHAVG